MNYEKKAELYNPTNGRSCSLPDLPDKRNEHSHCGNLLCSGNSCLKMTGTSFSRASVRLRESRYGHLCWSLPGGEVMLLGPYNTEIVSADGSSSRAGWNLAYRTE